MVSRQTIIAKQLPIKSAATNPIVLFQTDSKTDRNLFTTQGGSSVVYINTIIIALNKNQ
jgi:hypothetical protein